MKEILKSRVLIDHLIKKADSAGFRTRVLGEVEGEGERIPILSLSKKIKGKAPRILISAGIHGDEPAGPHAILSLLESFPAEWPEFGCCHVEIVPLINPTGFDLRQRNNQAGVDLNRAFGSPDPPAEIRWLMNDYRRRSIDLFVDLHEDVDTPGFYLYELAPSESEAFGPLIISALKKAGHPVNESPVIEGMPARDGLILRASRPFPRYFRKGAPQGLYMKKMGACRTLTFETPPMRPLDERVAMHLLSLRTVLSHWARKPSLFKEQPGGRSRS